MISPSKTIRRVPCLKCEAMIPFDVQYRLCVSCRRAANDESGASGRISYSHGMGKRAFQQGEKMMEWGRKQSRTLLAAGTAIAILLVGCAPQRSCHSEKIWIEEIGVCNAGALCVVRYSDGSNSRERFPMMGDMKEKQVCE